MEELIKEHKEAFGIEPNIIGMFWNDQEKIMDGIEEAVEKGQPYDEYLMLSDDEKKAWDSGNLKF